MIAAEMYHFLIEVLSDSRSANWPLVKSPLPVASILIAYLFFVLHLGPAYMKNRKPYSMNRVMFCYNIFVVIASGIVFYGLFQHLLPSINSLFFAMFLGRYRRSPISNNLSEPGLLKIFTTGYNTPVSFGCKPLDPSNRTPEALSLARWVWWLYMLKICELLDTIIFILRKKYNQVSSLHVYHHFSTVFLAWIMCKYAPGGMWTFNIIPNSAVHVVMYTYYLLASLGPELQKRIAPFKPYVTRLQLIQFVIMMIHTSQALLPWCEPTRKPLAIIWMFQIIIIFYMFCTFYRKTYLEKRKNRKTE